MNKLDQLKEATALLIAASTESRARLEARAETYGNPMDEPIKAIAALVKTLAENEADKVRA
jgi:hypothetical protein